MGLSCVVYAAYSFAGRGVAQSCASIVENFPPSLHTQVVTGRVRTPIAGPSTVRQALPPVVRTLPWRFVAARAERAVEERYRQVLRQCDPSSTVAYLWPGASLSVIRDTRSLGVPVVREMINTACATSGPILDRAYATLGRPATHAVTPQVIADETAELLECDYLFASNAEVEASLLRLGIPRERIVATSFGWDPHRLHVGSAPPTLRRGLRVLFVGSVGVRKGVPQLLDAWRAAGIDGELVLAGSVEPAVADLVAAHVTADRVRVAGFVPDVATIYRQADVFVFPTWEEGGPQVTYEAAAFGLPIVTTPMGAARIVEDGRTGLVVPAGDVDRLAQALRDLAADPGLRSRLGGAARAAVDDFAYSVVGRQRGTVLSDVAARRLRATV